MAADALTADLHFAVPRLVQAHLDRVGQEIVAVVSTLPAPDGRA